MISTMVCENRRQDSKRLPNSWLPAWIRQKSKKWPQLKLSLARCITERVFNTHSDFFDGQLLRQELDSSSFL
jgi:hypothetical protein